VELALERGSALPAGATDAMLLLETGWTEYELLYETSPQMVAKVRTILTKRAVVEKREARLRDKLR
jgi:hypothetical protein